MADKSYLRTRPIGLDIKSFHNGYKIKTSGDENSIIPIYTDIVAERGGDIYKAIKKLEEELSKLT